MSTVNKLGYGSPFYEIKNRRGETILPNNITQFEYCHSEKKDDKCIFVIETGDPSVLDLDYLQEKSKLEVTWGYRKGEISKSYIVYISEIKPKFSGKIITIVVEAVDKFASTAKQNSSRKMSQGNLEDIAGEIANKNGLDFNNELRITTGEREPLIYQGGYLSSQVDNLSLPREFFTYTDMPQSNKSEGRVLTELVDEEPGGPYVVEGHGDELTLKKRNLSQPSIKTYVWKGGEGDLINFTPETDARRRNSASSNVVTTGFDLAKKTHVETNSNVNNTEENYLGKFTEGTEGIDTIRLLNTDDPSRFQGGIQTTAVDATAVVIPDLGNMEFQQQEDSVDGDPDKVKAYGDNKKANSALKKNPANAVCIGDPAIESGKVITVNNVSTKLSGNYYIETAKHQIRNNGYLMQLSCLKNAVNTAPDTTDTNQVDEVSRSSRNMEPGPLNSMNNFSFIPGFPASDI